MTIDLLSLALISLIAAVCPLIAQSIPGRPVPETVLLLLAGALLGPHMAGAIQISDAIDFLSDLGLAFLFLLAGYEIEVKQIVGRQGKHGFLTWFVSLVIGFVLVFFTPVINVHSQLDAFAVAIALGTTAYGTLVPILKERELVGTPVGNAVVSYGTWGELGPVIAMALLLSTRAEWKTVLVLIVFAAVAVLVAVLPKRTRRLGTHIHDFLTRNANTTSQAPVRWTVLILVALVALSSVFDLDIVMGAFAAGFVLRHLIPAGNDKLEEKLDGIAFGFLIPVFFVCSGAKIDIFAVAAQPGILVGFIVLLLLVRGVPVFVSLSTNKEGRALSSHHRVTVALYCTTALPLIVAVTSVAVDSGTMTQETASVLVAAGAVTVFLMPFLASLTYRINDIHPLRLVREVSHDPQHAGTIVHDHWVYSHQLAKHDAASSDAYVADYNPVRALRHRYRKGHMPAAQQTAAAHLSQRVHDEQRKRLAELGRELKAHPSAPHVHGGAGEGDAKAAGGKPPAEAEAKSSVKPDQGDEI